MPRLGVCYNFFFVRFVSKGFEEAYWMASDLTERVISRLFGGITEEDVGGGVVSNVRV